PPRRWTRLSQSGRPSAHRNNNRPTAALSDPCLARHALRVSAVNPTGGDAPPLVNDPCYRPWAFGGVVNHRQRPVPPAAGGRPAASRNNKSPTAAFSDPCLARHALRVSAGTEPGGKPLRW